MIFITLPFIAFIIVFVAYRLRTRTNAAPILLTFTYWLWEYHASGNIRADLVIIYPVLFAVFLVHFWPRQGLKAVAIAFGLVLLNALLALSFYGLLDKYPG